MRFNSPWSTRVEMLWMCLFLMHSCRMGGFLTGSCSRASAHRRFLCSSINRPNQSMKPLSSLSRAELVQKGGRCAILDEAASG